MSISVPSTAARRARPAPLARLRAVPVPRPELGFLLILAGVLDLWSLTLNGWANTYYSAAVRSMSTNWHDFLFASFDKAGVMTVDKPPLSLWVQALSARVFGFNSLSILVPQALMGVATVALAYDLTRRRFGRAGGFVAGLVLATTPMTVAISRHNNPDALLVLCCTAALWAIVRGLEDGRMRWLVLSGVMIGLGFETKMLAALIIVPALAAAYLWVAPRGRRIAIRQLAAGGAAMAVVGLAWPVLVWLTPAGSRPWISGTSDNSIWSLIFGYNGLGRVDGQSGGPGGVGGGPGGGGGATNTFFGGQTGALRLLNSALGGQAGWLLGFAVVGGLAIMIASRLRRTDARTGWVIAAGGAFLTTAVVFSTAKGIFHPYYVSLLAPFTAALVGAGAKTLLDGGVVNRFLAPLAVAAGLATELVILHNTDGSLNWVIPVLVVALVATAAVFAAGANIRARIAVLAVALAVLMIAPATWAAQTLGHPTNGTFPSGGPVSASMDGGRFGGGGGPGAGGPGGQGAPTGGPPGGFAGRPSGQQAGAPPAGFGGRGGGGGGGGALGGGNSAALNEAVAYVKAHGGGTIGVSSQTSAAPAIITNGVSVAGLGGFSGRESQVSVSWLAQAVQSGQIRWVLADGSSPGMPNDSRVGSQSVMTAVAQVGKKVTTVSGATLYDLQGQASALLALK
jgi:4-amino-4-deoxy-L-arabinose transferase-like glycosyltransferase